MDLMEGVLQPSLTEGGLERKRLPRYRAVDESLGRRTGYE